MGAITPISKAGIAIGFGLVAFAGAIAIDAARMQVPPAYARVGPHIFPFAVAAGLAAMGVYFAWSSWAPGREREIVSEDQPTDWRSLGLIAIGLLGHMMLLKTLGFIIVSAALFVVVAVAFGSRSWLRDIATGLILAAVTYVGFTRGLGLQLPAGLFAGIF